MSYIRQEFAPGQIFTEAEADQIEENIAAHVHGVGSVSGVTVSAFAKSSLPSSLNAASGEVVISSFNLVGGTLGSNGRMRWTAYGHVDTGAPRTLTARLYYSGSLVATANVASHAEDLTTLGAIVMTAELGSQNSLDSQQAGVCRLTAVAVSSGGTNERLKESLRYGEVGIDSTADHPFHISLQVSAGGSDVIVEHWVAEVLT